MFIATCVVAAVLSALFIVSAVGKLRRDPSQMATMSKVGFPEDKLWLLASAEAAAAAGLIAGLFWWPIGAAAAVGAIAYFVGAVIAHLRVGDRNISAPLIIMLLAIAALVLRIASM